MCILLHIYRVSVVIVELLCQENQHILTTEAINIQRNVHVTTLVVEKQQALRN